MPTVAIKRDDLFEAIGQVFTEEEFDELCFQFGIELDEVTSERTMMSKELGTDQGIQASDDVIYKIEIPANRYDLLCLEGLSTALRVFLGLQATPVYKIDNHGHDILTMNVTRETIGVRPYVVCAVLRDVTFTPTSYRSFIDLQDKLHQTLCKRRTLAAMGTHDLDKIRGPFVYTALPPSEIEFVALNQTRKMKATELMEFYKSDNHLKKYLHIIEGNDAYPIIFDQTGNVLSMPPIINSEYSKITVNTKNILIECTTNDFNKSKTAVEVLVASFSKLCAKPFTVSTVNVVYPDGRVHASPDFAYRTEVIPMDYINKRIGIHIDSREAIQLLRKMGLESKLSSDGHSLSVQVPPSRSDIMHICDIMEDVAIGYGFNKVVMTLPDTNTVGRPYPVNKLSDLLRSELAMAGYTEALTFSLCSHDENFAYLNRHDNKHQAVVLANPKTQEYQIARTSLLPGLLKTVACNKNVSLPIKLFEVSDVVLLDPSYDVGARNERHACGLFYNKHSGLELIQGLVDRLMQVLNVKPVSYGEKGGYYIKESKNETYFPDRSADIFHENKKIGSFGILHPDVLNRFELSLPCSVFELDITAFV